LCLHTKWKGFPYTALLSIVLLVAQLLRLLRLAHIHSTASRLWQWHFG
jgi:hypothetical protein